MAVDLRKNRYPLATKDGKVIDLEVARALLGGVYLITDAPKVITLPDVVSIMTLSCNKLAVIDFRPGNAPLPGSSGVEQAQNCFVLRPFESATLEVSLPRFRVALYDSGTTGVLTLNGITAWSELASESGTRSF